MTSTAPASLSNSLPSDLSSARALRTPRLLLRECLAGVMTALALVPEVISFSIVAGVEPHVSLLASVVLGLVTSLLGGRPAMVTAAAGSVALVIGPTVKAHGAAYVLPIVLLAGALQLAFGAAGLARWLRHVPRSVTLGFVNALGLLIFWAQVPHVAKPSAAVLAAFALTLAVVLLLPRLTRAVPSPLVAIAGVTTLDAAFDLKLPSVGGGGSLAAGLPGLTSFAVPFDLATLAIIGPAAVSVAFVGLLESLLTARLVDELTGTPSSKDRESWALGIANLCAGSFGGIAGCAMIGQTVVNVELGGARTRISTAVAALVLLSLVTGLRPIMAQLPMVALAAVMMVVAVKTIDWNNVKPSALRRAPVAGTAVMAATVAATVSTDNLALGVAAGVALHKALPAAAELRARLTRQPRSEATPAATASRYLDDPRVFFAAERTLLAWQRSSIAVLGMGFVIERFALFLRLVNGAALPAGHGHVSLCLAVLFLLAGALIAVISAWQYLRFSKTLGAAELPPGHFTWPGPALNLLLAVAAGSMALWFVLSA